MKHFLAITLYVFAGCAALGWIPPAVLAARARRAETAMLTLLAAGFVIYVLVAAGWELAHG